MHNKSTFVSLLFVVIWGLITQSNAIECDTAWVRILAELPLDPQLNEFRASTLDSWGNAYAVGRAGNNGLIAKISREGDWVWHHEVTPSSQLGANFMDVARSHNEGIIVAGAISEAASSGSSWVVCCYNSAGDLVWERIDDFVANVGEAARYIACSESAIFIGGHINVPLEEIVIMKLTEGGDSLWTASIEGVNNELKQLYIYSDGTVGGVASYADGIRVLSFRLSADGQLLWSKLWTDSTGTYLYNKPAGAVLDNGDNLRVYSTIWSQGTSAGALIGYSPTGELTANHIYEAIDTSGYLEFTDLMSTSSGQLIASAYAWDGFHLCCYTFDGDELWTQVGGAKASMPIALALDRFGNPLVTGYNTGDSTMMDIFVSCYQPNGVPLWQHTYSPNVLVIETPRDAVVSPLGELVVVGQLYDAWSYPLAISYAYYECGDADANSITTISDVVFLINYIFALGITPFPIISADADQNDIVTISDAVYLINYIFAGGPAPCEG